MTNRSLIHLFGFSIFLFLPFSLDWFEFLKTEETTAASCGLLVDAGPDIFICEDESGFLNGRVGGNGLREFYWEPPDGLSNPKVLNPSVTVSERTCYVLTATKKSDVNLVRNGNFEMGATGFSTDYSPGTMSCFGLGFLDCAGTYAVMMNPMNGHVNFAPCGDHTSGSGNMMVCNGAQGFVNVWCQTVIVNPNTDHCFFAYACSVEPTSPASLEFTINGSTIGNIGLSGATCLWEELRADWNSGAATVATICIQNLVTVGGGNDFAIDDIQLYEVCQQKDTVCVDVVKIEANINPPDKICCDHPIIILDGNGSSFGPDYSYCWTASNGGHIVSGAMTLTPTVDRAGRYTLTVKGPHGCEKEVEVEVEGSTIPPKAFAMVRDTLDCANKTVRLSGGASPSDGITYQWTGPNGYTSTEEDPLVEDTGKYTLLITDECGCFDEVCVTVYGKDNLLFLNILGDSITCQKDFATLIPEANQNKNITYNWSGPGGYNSNEDSIMVSDSGWYVLKIENADGCIDIDSFRVELDTTPPNALIFSEDISCKNGRQGEIKLNSDSTNSIEWYFNGMKIPGDSILIITTPGTYTAVLTSDNSCVDSIDVDIVADTLAPIFDLADKVIDCDSDSILVCLDNLTPANATVQWYFMGQPIATTTCFYAKNEGWYVVETMGQNECSTADSVFVNALRTRPPVSLTPRILDCNNPSYYLKLNNSAEVVTWTTPGGQIITNDSILITIPGKYYIELIDGQYECPSIDSFVVTSDFSKPSATLSADTLSCTKDSVLIQLMSSDTIVQYEWSGPNGFFSTLKNPNANDPGTYSVIITGRNGCMDTIQINVERDADYPVVQIFTDTITCKNPIVDISLTSSRNDLSYLWSGPFGSGTTDSILTTGKAGMYEVEITTSDGCIINKTINVEIDTTAPDFELRTKDTINCVKMDVKVDLSNPPNTQSIAWSGPNGYSNNSASVTLVEGGIYSVIVESKNGCKSTKSIEIVIDTIAPDLRIAGDTIDCNNSSITLVGISTYNNINFQWTGPLGALHSDPTWTVSRGGAYELTIQAVNGCLTTRRYMVEVDTLSPVINISGQDLNCKQPTTTIVSTRSPNTRISWSGPGLGQVNTDSIVISQPGWYYANTVASSGCIGVDSIFIAIDTMMPSAIARDSFLTCTNDVIVLNGTFENGNVVKWQNSSGTVLSNTGATSIDAPGNYIFTVIDTSNGCENSIEINVEDRRDLANLDLNIQQPDCEAQLGRININNISGAASPYEVYFNGVLQTSGHLFNDLPSGEYEIKVIDANGCITIDSISINDIVSPQLDLLAEIEIELGDTVQLNLNVLSQGSSIATIKWNPDYNISCLDCFNPLVWPERPTVYFVDVIDSSGCLQTLYIKVFVNIPNVFIPNVFSPNDDGVNDNFIPFSNYPERVKIKQMMVFSRWGELVFQGKDLEPNDIDAGWDGTFHGRAFRSGGFCLCH